MKHIRYLTIIVACVGSLTAHAQGSITVQEYWIDGNSPARTTITNGASVSLNGLEKGLHSITLRVQDDAGLWSSPETRYFVIAQSSVAATAITACEYWMDGNIANRQSVANGATVSLEGMNVGLHSITVRAQDDTGLWSSPETRYFVIARSSVAATAITTCEYWFDGNIENRQSVENGAMVSLEALPSGLHSITLRAQDDTGLWSSPETRFFIKTAVAVEAEITQALYWFDDDTDHAVLVSLSGPEGIVEIDDDFVGFRRGDHKLSWTVGDSQGRWSNPMVETFFLDIPTGINAPEGSVPFGSLERDAQWTTLDGKKLDGRPTRTGVYLLNGRKVIVK